MNVTPPATGLPVLGWLFAAGFVLLLGLVAWAVFGPSRDDEDRPDAGPAAVVLLALALAALSPGRVEGHATAQRYEPRQGAALATAPPEIRIAFDGAIEGRFSTIELLDPDGRPVKTPAPAELDPETRRVLSLRLPALGPGAYTVRWRVMAVDGHRTAGRYSFTVKPAP